MAQARRVRRPPALGAYLAVPHDHDPVHLCGIFQLVEQRLDAFTGDPNLWRSDAFKFFPDHLFSLSLIFSLSLTSTLYGRASCRFI
jgi:hypothetical protein